MKVIVSRTHFVPKGLGYDVLVPASEVPHYQKRPGDFQIVLRVGVEHVEFVYATLPETHFARPKGIDRMSAFLEHQRLARKQMLELGRRVFPELWRLPPNTERLPVCIFNLMLPGEEESSRDVLVNWDPSVTPFDWERAHTDYLDGLACTSDKRTGAPR